MPKQLTKRHRTLKALQTVQTQDLENKVNNIGNLHCQYSSCQNRDHHYQNLQHLTVSMVGKEGRLQHHLDNKSLSSNEKKYNKKLVSHNKNYYPLKGVQEHLHIISSIACQKLHDYNRKFYKFETQCGKIRQVIQFPMEYTRCQHGSVSVPRPVL